MTDYKEIKGKTILNISSDLDNAEGEGQIWFNTSGNDFKTIVGLGSWSTGGNLNEARRTPGGAGNGTQTAASIFGGTAPPSPNYIDKQEYYDGSSWTEVADINTARYEPKCGAGTQTSSLMAGGIGPGGSRITNSEEWNGSAWAEGNDINTNSAAGAGVGTQTAALGIGGSDYPTLEDSVESYDGTSWTEIADINNGRYYVKGNGTQTAALISGGASFSPAPDGTHWDKTETWNGTAWTEGASMNTTRAYDVAAFGISTSAIHAGGGNGSGNQTASEEWNGTAWAEGNDLVTAIRYTVGAGTSSSSGLQASGLESNDSNTSQEWSYSTLSTGAWASGGNLPNPASSHTAFGTQTAGVHAGGELSGGANAEAFHYDGSSWTAGGNLATPRNLSSGYGTQTAGGIIGGDVAPGIQDVHETYDGSSWTEAGDINTGRSNAAGASSGTTTAALYAAGNTGPWSATNASEEYNGTSWAEGDNLNTARLDVAGAGTQTAGLAISGNTASPDALKTEVESYDGTSWTEVGDVNTAVDRFGSMAGGTQDIAIKVSGRDGTGDPNPRTVNVEQWDGTSWAEVANVSTGRYHGAVGSGPSAASAFLSGGTPPTTNATEEWTLARNVKTITD